MAKTNQYTEEGKKNKLKYINDYNSKHYRSVNVMFRLDDAKQMELWDWLHGKYSTAGFLRDLALEAMKKEKEGKQSLPFFILFFYFAISVKTICSLMNMSQW